MVLPDNCLATESSAGRGFIVGAPRSGTTLLMNLVAAHPQIAPVYETEFIRHLLALCHETRWAEHSWAAKIGSYLVSCLNGRRPEKSARRFIDKTLPLYESTDRRRFGKTKDEFFPFGNRCIEYNFCELVRETENFINALVSRDRGCSDPFIMGRCYLDRLFAIHCSRMDRPFWVNKTPSLARCVDLLHEMYPECAIIHIVRDGRDVALSTVSVRRGPNNVRDAARRWHDMVRGGRRLRGNAKYLEVRYEELIAGPERIMKIVFDALRVDACAVRDLPGFKIYGHREKVWRHGLTKKDKLDFASEAGDLLIQLGYEKDDAW